MVIAMMVRFQIINFMVKVLLLKKMVTNIQEIGNLIKNMVQGYKKKMVRSMMDNGLMINKVAKEK